MSNELISRIRAKVETVQFLDGMFGSPVYYATEEILSYLDDLEKETQNEHD